jgi:Spy/CpxP family protein refolding chaperone
MKTRTRSLAVVVSFLARAAIAQTTNPDCPMHAAHAAAETPPPAGAPQAHPHDHAAMSPYAGKEGSEVKALAAEELQAYRDGTGMGLAKPAELNHCPGPRHVLDLARDLELTGTQSEQLKRVFDRMHERAIRLGGEIIEKEKALDCEFAAGTIDEAKLTEMTAAIARLQAELRTTHLEAHLETKRILTARQVVRYDELRGYARPAG